MMVSVDKLQPGDVILYRPLHMEGEPPNDSIGLTAMAPGESCRDRFGREMVRYWVRGKADSNSHPCDVEREGFMTYGPGAEVEIARAASGS